MNCHEENKGGQEPRKHNHLKHLWHMILCCGLPIVIIGLLPIIGRFSPEASVFIGKLTPYLCPIMMLLMLPMMFRSHKTGSCCEDKNNKSVEKANQ